MITRVNAAMSTSTRTRYDDLRSIETEVGTLIRRVKRVMGERAREIHPDLHPITYFILTHLAMHGPLRGADLSDAFGMDKGGVSRQVQTLVDLGRDRGGPRTAQDGRPQPQRPIRRAARALERHRAVDVRPPAGVVQPGPLRRLTPTFRDV